MKNKYLNKIDIRLTAIQKKQPGKRDKQGRVLKHPWQIYKILMRGRYKPQMYVTPLTEG